MIFRLSINSIGIESNHPLQHPTIVLHSTSKRYMKLTRYFHTFEFTIDCCLLEDTTSGTKHIVNTEGHLGEVITKNRINKYNHGLEGKTTEKQDTRQIYFDSVSSLCTVTGIINSMNRIMYSGSCCDYWKTRYCQHAAVFQYKKELQTYGVPIATNKAKRKRNGNQPRQVITDLKR